MIDFHSHILPNIDDGSCDIEETIEMIKEAQEAGFTKIISTSHYYLKYFEVDEAQRKECINNIFEELKKSSPNTKVEVLVGSEIFITNSMVDLLAEHKASSINNSRYVLFELPFREQPPMLKDIIYKLISNKYIPVIAHPERYKYVQSNPNLLIELIDLGVLFQSNFGSVIGQYGNEAKKTVKLLLKNNFIHFLGSDAHRKNSVYKIIPEAIEEMKNIITEEKIKELTTINPGFVLNNEKFNIKKPTKLQKGLFGFKN